MRTIKYVLVGLAVAGAAVCYYQIENTSPHSRAHNVYIYLLSASTLAFLVLGTIALLSS